MRRSSRPRGVDAGAERSASGGAFVAGGARSGPPCLIQGQRVLLGRRRARIGVHAFFQAGGGLNGGGGADHSERCESSGCGHTDGTHAAEDSDSSSGARLPDR